MLFSPYKNSVDKNLGQKIINEGKYLGRSHYEKDCYWGCHQFDGKYYISLNNEYYNVYEADEEDIENYLEVKEPE